MTFTVNLRAIIGDNAPPADPTPFELSRDEIESLVMEARNWADATPIETQEQADAIARLKDELRKAGKLADERRIAENEPFDAGKAAVQAKYNPLIQKDKGKVALATAALNRTLEPYLQRLECERMAIAAKAREEAEAKAAAAQAAIRAANVADLEARERAEAMLADAQKAERLATKAENDKAHAKGTGRATGLRTSYRAEIVDAREFAKHIWLHHNEAMADFLRTTAQRLVDQGEHALPGIVVHTERSL